MITRSKNKDMADQATKENKATVAGVLQEYHYAGGMEYFPKTIIAASQAEADAEYEKTKVKINQ